MTQFLQVLVAVGAVVGALYLLMRPHWVFVLILCMWPVEQLLAVYIPYLAANPRLTNYAMGGLAVSAMLLRFFRRDPIVSAYRNPLTYIVLLFYLLWLLNIFVAPPAARDMMLERLFHSSTYQFILLVVLPLLIVDIDEFRRSLPGIMVLGTVVSVLIMINPNSSYHSGRLVLDLGMVGGGIHMQGNPLALAEMGGMIALIAALVVPARASQMYFVIRAAAFISGMGLAIGSGSRGQVLAAGICGVLFFPMARRLASPKHFIFGAVSFGILVMGLMTVFRLFIGGQNQKRWEVFGMLRDTLSRLDMVQELLQVYLETPARWLTGLGTGAYADIASNRHVEYVHNVAAEALCEQGLLGGTLFVAMLALSIRYGVRLWRWFLNQDAERSTVAILLALSMFSLLQSLKQGSIAYPAPFYWWMIVAKLYFHQRHERALAGVTDDAALDESWDELDPEPEHEPLPNVNELVDPETRQNYALG